MGKVGIRPGAAALRQTGPAAPGLPPGPLADIKSQRRPGAQPEGVGALSLHAQIQAGRRSPDRHPRHGRRRGAQGMRKRDHHAARPLRPAHLPRPSGHGRRRATAPCTGVEVAKAGILRDPKRSKTTHTKLLGHEPPAKTTGSTTSTATADLSGPETKEHATSTETEPMELSSAAQSADRAL